MTQAQTPTPDAPRAAATKAVIPVAGLGTRFLPATKATPKEMLPVVDKPAIQYVVEEAVGAGLHDVLMITGRGKRAIEDHFDRAPELEAALEAKGDDARTASARASDQLADVHFVRQGEANGLGHAVLRAKDHVGDEPFAVLLGDDLIDERDHLLARMVAVQREHGGSVVALLEVPPSQVHLYGCAQLADGSKAGSTSGGDGGEGADDADVVTITGMVEKPDPADAPSNLAIIGRYVLDPSVFAVLERTAPGRGGEIQLTDALQELAVSDAPGGGVRGVVFRGRRYDTGDKLDYLKAVVRLASTRDDLGPDLQAWLKDWVASGFDDSAPTHAPVE